MHMKRCLISLIIKGMQIKTTMRYHFSLIKMTILRKEGRKEVASIGKDMEKLGHSRIAGENV